MDKPFSEKLISSWDKGIGKMCPECGSPPGKPCMEDSYGKYCCSARLFRKHKNPFKKDGSLKIRRLKRNDYGK